VRLIDADAFTIIKVHTKAGGKTVLAEVMQKVLDTAPTVDAVPVIRCKDCKWYGRVDKRRFYRGADCLQGHLNTIVPDRDYCSMAEPKETE
jgi:hypothetical protein